MRTKYIILAMTAALCVSACDVNSVRTGQDSHTPPGGAPAGDAGTGQSTPQEPLPNKADSPRTPTAGERGSGTGAR